MYYFFFSYARDNSVGNFLDTFYEDLKIEINQATGIPVEEVGFRDNRSIPLGANWNEEIAEALRTCKTFVAILSPAYFRSPYCGKEFEAFRLRLDSVGLEADEKYPLLLPVLWTPIDECLPEAMQCIQYTHDNFGQIYADLGLRRLIINSKFSEDYRNFLDHFTDALIGATQRCKLPPGKAAPNFDETPNSFGKRDLFADLNYVPSGPRHVRFVVIAGSNSEMQAVRENLTPYGPNPCEWCPFLPLSDDPIGSLVQSIASSERLTSDFLFPKSSLIGQIEKAYEHNEIVMIVADAWSMKLERFAEVMRLYDSRHFLNCAVMILWNRNDPETAAEEHALGERFVATFPNKTHAAPDPIAFRQRVDSREAFENALRQSLVEIQGRIMKKQKVLSRPKGMKSSVFPCLTTAKVLGEAP